MRVVFGELIDVELEVDQQHGAVFERVGRIDDWFWRCRLDHACEQTDRQRRPDVIRVDSLAVPVALHGDLPASRSEEHTSELQSQSNLVCRLLLEKKNKKQNNK